MAGELYLEMDPDDKAPQKNENLAHNLFIFYLSATRALCHVKKKYEQLDNAHGIVHTITYHGEAKWATDLFWDAHADIDLYGFNYLIAFLSDNALIQHLNREEFKEKFISDPDLWCNSIEVLKAVTEFHDFFGMEDCDIIDGFHYLLAQHCSDTKFYETLFEFAYEQWPDETDSIVLTVQSLVTPFQTKFRGKTIRKGVRDAAQKAIHKYRYY